MFYMSFSDWLLAEMNQREWNNSDLARKANLSRQAIGYYLEGRKPNNEAIEKIAKAFDIPIESVMRQANILPPSSDNNDPWVIATQRQLAQLTPESRDIADTLIKALRDREKGQRKK